MRGAASPTRSVIGVRGCEIDRSAVPQGTPSAPSGDAVPMNGRENPHRNEDPLLLVDIDGVVSLFGFASDERPIGTWIQADGTPHLISGTAGAHLLALAEFFRLVWCSGWEERANDHLPAALALPGPLPYLIFDRSPGSTRAHWKLNAIDDFAGARQPLAWIDDALNDACRDWAAARPAPTLLVQTEAHVGVTAAHVDQLIAWAAGLAER